MANTINEIIKVSLETLRKRDMSLTPNNYYKVFCEVAQSKNIVIEDCLKVKKSLDKVDKVFQEEAKRHKVHDVDDLLKFFIAVINRSNMAEQQKTVQSYVLLSKRLLQIMPLLSNKQATTLSNASLERLETSSQPQTIDTIRDKWLDFMTSYDEKFLEKLDKIGIKYHGDLETLVNDMYKYAKNEKIEDDIDQDVVALIVASLTPSIASSMNDKLANISYDLRANPEMIREKGMQEDIKKLITTRIELDKKEVSKRLISLSSLLDAIDKKIIDLANKSEGHAKEVVNIRNNLRSIDMKNGNFETIQSQLLNIVNSLENETTSLTKHMQKDKTTIDELQLKIKKLENELVEAKKESTEDFLTHVATKRALQTQLEHAEEAYNRYNIEYSVCFFDIDRFKAINDTYGHEAGDVILATLGKILNKYVRKVDFVGRFGGEEFLVILPNISLAQAIVFADKIRRIIENFKFIYKKERINVTVSGGVSQRGLNNSMNESVDKADKELYHSKNSGRNQISPKIKQV